MAASDRSRIGRRFGVSAAFVAMLLANSCADFARTNPFDPAVPVTLTLSGPDSTFAQFDTVQFTVTTDPAYDFDPPDWRLDGLLRLDNNGAYRVGQIENYGGRPAAVTISVKIGARTATKTVNVTFRPKTLRVRNCSDDAKQVTFYAFGSGIRLCTTVLDAHGGLIARNGDVTPYALVARVIDPSVVELPFPRGLSPTGNGTSLVVFTYGPASDTMTVTVQQRARYLTISPGICAGPPLSIGQSVQLTVGAPGRDANQNLLVDQSLAERDGQDMRWRLTWYDSTRTPPVTVTPLGLLTPIAAGDAWLTTSSSTNPTGISPLICFIQVR
ncbi:MAG: hypothetical protein ACJ79A_03010 [Gemmatimonadaceae bacterium]